MKRLSLALLFAALALAPAAAWDSGLDLVNDSSYAINDNSDEGTNTLSQTDTATLWASFPVGKNATLFISGLYEFSGDFATSSSEYTPYRFDFGRTELSGQTGALRFAVGRIALSDSAARIITGLNDGAKVDWSIGNTTVSAAAAYRGFIYKEDARSFLEKADYTLYDDDDKVFAPARAVASLGVKSVELLPWHDVGLEGWAQFDLAGKDKVVNSQYLEPWIEGRLGTAFRWKAWQITEFIQTGSETAYSLAAGGRIRWSRVGSLKLHVTETVLWAQGLTDDFTAFTPIQQEPVTSLSLFSYADILTAITDVSIAPAGAFTLSAACAALFRATDNEPAYGNLRADASGSWLGLEGELRATVRPYPDLAFTAAGGLFMPNTATMYQDDEPIRWTANLVAKLSL